jgi:ABC-type dipeptide/oligopeptide/nickel transport system ATPase subunit
MVNVGVAVVRTRFSSAHGVVLQSGKSTLPGQLAGCVRAPAGTVLFDGAPPHDLPSRAVHGTVALVQADDWPADGE